MNIEVLLFAALAKEAGVEKLQISLPDNTTVDEALSKLVDQNPWLKGFSRSLATAVNHEYVGGEHRLHDGDELALIPPVSGG
jgi:sulfur-carrier protein